jgi:homocysteine S-methyltransferase
MTIAVELDPPAHNRAGDALQFLLNGADLLKDAGADLITMADNPCADSRGDCAVLAPLVSRISGIPVMPHLACRDRGVRALRS